MHLLTFVAALAVLAGTCRAQVTAITDRTQWQSAVGPYTSVTFEGLSDFTIVTDQYAEQGILFTDGNDFVRTTGSYSDGHGLVSTDGFGNLGMIHISFLQPVQSIALDFIGSLQLALYNDGALIFTSNQYVAGFTPFVGLISIAPFDAAVVFDYNDPTVAIDNIHFGPPIPAPGTLALISLSAAASAGRRKRRCDS